MKTATEAIAEILKRNS